MGTARVDALNQMLGDRFRCVEVGVAHAQQRDLLTSFDPFQRFVVNAPHIVMGGGQQSRDAAEREFAIRLSVHSPDFSVALLTLNVLFHARRSERLALSFFEVVVHPGDDTLCIEAAAGLNIGHRVPASERICRHVANGVK